MTAVSREYRVMFENGVIPGVMFVRATTAVNARMEVMAKFPHIVVIEIIQETTRKEHHER